MPRDRLQAHVDPQLTGPRFTEGGPAAVGGMAAPHLQTVSRGHQEVPVLAVRPGVPSGAQRAREPLQEPVRGRAGRLRARNERVRLPLAGDV